MEAMAIGAVIVLGFQYEENGQIMIRPIPQFGWLEVFAKYFSGETRNP